MPAHNPTINPANNSNKSNSNALALREESEDDGAEEDHTEPESGDELEEDNDDELSERIDIPQKRKHLNGHGHGPKKRHVAHAPAVPNADDHHGLDDEPEPAAAAAAPKITYNFSILSLAELAKATRSQHSQARFVELFSNLVWEDFWAQMKIKIIDVLFPGEAFVEDDAFEVFFSIPRHIKDLLPLTTAADYNHLIKNALKIKKDPAVKIVAKQVKKAKEKNVNKENDVTGPTSDNAQPKPRKSRAPRASDILPGNVSKNENIKRIRSQWTCNHSSCPSEICYVSLDSDHLPLGMELQDKWAAAMDHFVHGEPSATLEHPPNIREFDIVSAHTAVSRSPLLQAQLNSMKKEKGEPIQIHNHITYPQPATVGVAPAPPISQGSSRLVLNTSTAGVQMDIESFIRVFNLPSSILQHFQAHAITGTHAFQHISSDDLIAMNFKIGETIDLNEAIKLWASSE